MDWAATRSDDYESIVVDLNMADASPVRAALRAVSTYDYTPYRKSVRTLFRRLHRDIFIPRSVFVFVFTLSFVVVNLIFVLRI